MTGIGIIGVIAPGEGETAIGALAREFLDQADADGWDQHATVAAIVRDDAHWALLPLPIPEVIWNYARDPITVLRALAISVRDSGLATPSGYVGHLFMTEGWAFHHGRLRCSAGGEEGCDHTRWVDEGKSIADHPDGIEERDVTAVTADGQVVWANQVRGEKPSILLDTSIDNSGRFEGRVLNALREVVEAVVSQRQCEEDVK